MVNPMIAEVTLIRRMVYRMEKPHAIGAGHNTISTPDAPLPVHQDHAFRCLVGSAYGTYLDAGRFVALVAEFGNEKGLINFFIRNILELSAPQIDPAISESISCLFGGIGEDFSVFGYDISFNPGSGYITVERNFVFELTGLDTKTAADTFISIDEKYKTRGRNPGLSVLRPEKSAQSFDQQHGGGSSYGQFYKFSPVHLFLLAGLGCLVRIMTQHALQPGIMPIRINTFDL
jgi:hypothetical protein